MAITVSTASRRVGNWQVAEDTASGMPCRRSWISVMTPERALRADEQPGQVVAGGGFAHAPAGADQPPVRPSRRSGPSRSPAWCRSAPRWCRRRGSRDMPPMVQADVPGSTGKNSPRSRRCVFNCSRVTPASTRQSMSGWLTSRIRGHPRQVERDAAAHRRHVALQRGAGAPRHDGDVLGVAQRQQAGGFVRGFDERDRVGQDRRLGVLAVRVVVPQRRVGGDAVAQEVAGGGDDGLDRHGRLPDLLCGQHWTGPGGLARFVDGLAACSGQLFRQVRRTVARTGHGNRRTKPRQTRGVNRGAELLTAGSGRRYRGPGEPACAWPNPGSTSSFRPPPAHHRRG